MYPSTVVHNTWPILEESGFPALCTVQYHASHIRPRIRRGRAAAYLASTPSSPLPPVALLILETVLSACLSALMARMRYDKHENRWYDEDGKPVKRCIDESDSEPEEDTRPWKRHQGPLPAPPVCKSPSQLSLVGVPN